MSVHHTGLPDVSGWILSNVGYITNARGQMLIVSMISGSPEIYYGNNCCNTDNNLYMTRLIGQSTVQSHWDGRVSVKYGTAEVYYTPCEEKCCQTPSLLTQYQSIGMSIAFRVPAYELSDGRIYAMIGGLIVLFCLSKPLPPTGFVF